MTSMYYVKVYYTKQQPEIRRFQIDISPEKDTYQELCTKVATYQPDIQLTGFTLQYIDEEQERITFSSNEELRSAIASNTDANPLKVFVTPNQRSQQASATANKECHTGVECDGCQGPVVGCRYKCVVCPNYDLCETCSAAGIHSEHNMMKISKPGDFYHPYGPRHHHGGGGRRHPHHHPRHSPPPFTPSAEFFENIQAQIPQWLPNRENRAHFRQHMQQHFDTIRTNTQTHMQNSKQYLENVGQYLQQALSPFGIDCDYRVDESTNKNQQQTASSTTTTTENPAPTEPSAVPKNTDEASSSAASNEGISSLLNIFRIGHEGTASTITINEPTSQKPDKAVEECVEKMKAMGFAEPNDKLMELIRAKNGDLNSVLDEMTRYD